MLDAEVYINRLMLRDVEALADTFEETLLVAPDIDVNELDELPAILFTLTGDGQVANGDGLWSFILTLSTFGYGMDQAKQFAKLGYDIVHAWDQGGPGTVIEIDDEETWVSSVDDIDLPSRLPSALIAGRNVVQYVGSFALALRN